MFIYDRHILQCFDKIASACTAGKWPDKKSIPSFYHTGGDCTVNYQRHNNLALKSWLSISKEVFHSEGAQVLP